MGPRKKNHAKEDWKKRLMRETVNMTAQSRQRIWQLLNNAEGLCDMCSAPITHYATMCDRCAEKKRLQVQSRRGYKPWRPGGKGRPPKVRPEIESGAPEKK
jgi:hypothetical protein